MSNKRFSVNPHLLAAVCAVALLALSPAVALAQDGRCPQDDPSVAAVSVSVDLATGSLEVDPDSSVVYLDPGPEEPNRVCWTITGLGDGDQLRLEDKDDDSPVYFPSLQRTASSRSPYLNSGNPSRLGTWRYSVVVRNASGEILAELDPEVIVRGGSR